MINSVSQESLILDDISFRSTNETNCSSEISNNISNYRINNSNSNSKNLCIMGLILFVIFICSFIIIFFYL